LHITDNFYQTTKYYLDEYITSCEEHRAVIKPSCLLSDKVKFYQSGDLIMVLKNRKVLTLIVLTFLLSFCCYGNSVKSEVHAEPTLTISVNKNSGYSVGGDINGKFTIAANGSEDIVFVEFYLDAELQLNSTDIPHVVF
jgi:hypothetical protein